MSRRLRYSLCACIAGCLAGVPVAHADSPLNAAQLQASCRSAQESTQSAAASPCIAYIQGFLDGAVDVDGRIALDPEVTSESFSERAYRTRLARKYLSRPPYCVEESVPLSRLVEQLLDYCEDRQFDAELSAGSLLARVLRHFHPCR